MSEENVQAVRSMFEDLGSGNLAVGLPPYGWVITFRDGKVVSATLYMDRAEALEAAGLAE